MRNDWQRKQTQVVWADLEAWIQQLHEDHGVRVRFNVFLPVPGDGVTAGVSMEAYKWQGVGKEQPVKRDWRVFNDQVSGIVEQYALRMVSALLLELENDKERAERQAPLPLWRD